MTKNLLRTSLNYCFTYLPSLLFSLFILGLLPAHADDLTNNPADTEQQWGKETIDLIRQDFYDPETGLYRDTLDLSGHKSGASMMWGCGVQLSAQNAASRLDPSYAAAAASYAKALDGYWIIAQDLGGYNPAPGNITSSSDRYYDDNEWIILDLTDLYQQTGRPEFLRKAEELMKFVLSGEDAKLGGGIYWHEPKPKEKNTCSNAPAITGLLRLYMLTGTQSYLDEALRLYAWINATLQDPKDGLYYDHIDLDGRVAQFKLTYNTALMIRANCLFYQATGKDSYLAEARRLGQASIHQWVDPKTGVVRDAGRFSHLLLDAFVDLNNLDSQNPLWLATVDRCVTYVHDHLKDANGHYPEAWDHSLPDQPLQKWSLIDQASVARAYLSAAGAYRNPMSQ
jgi:mannose/cellobiose epimerase-like protein (N-acyl-D-glucosamine 2-epimerase family)